MRVTHDADDGQQTQVAIESLLPMNPEQFLPSPKDEQPDGQTEGKPEGQPEAPAEEPLPDQKS